MARNQQIFRVAPGCSVISRQGVLFRAGSQVPVDQFKKQDLEGHVKSGFLLPQGSEIQPGELPPGVVDPGPLSSSDKARVTTTGRQEPSVQIQTSPSPRRVEAKSDPSPWTIDPASLKNKDLDQLNAMVQERDSEVPAFETEQEALAHLTQDFKAE